MVMCPSSMTRIQRQTTQSLTLSLSLTLLSLLHIFNSSGVARSFRTRRIPIRAQLNTIHIAHRHANPHTPWTCIPPGLPYGGNNSPPLDPAPPAPCDTCPCECE